MATLLITAQDERVEKFRSKLLADRQEIEEALAKLADVPILPEPSAEGSVIRFRKYEQAYLFAAIKVGYHWYTTQNGSRSDRQGYPPRTWDELLAWIGERNYNTVEVLA